MSHFPIALVASYCIFSVVHLYMGLHSRTFRGSNQRFHYFLCGFVGLAWVFQIGFLIAFGFRTRWFAPLLLVGASLLLGFLFSISEALIAKRDFAFIVSLSGFIVLPVCGVIEIASLP